MLFLGLGAGLSFAAVMTLAMSGATPQDAGLASGLVNTSVQVGGAIGLAVLATLAAERTDALKAAGETTAAALNGGYHLAYLVGAALLGVGVLVSIFVLRSPKAGAGAGGRGRAGVRVRGIAAPRSRVDAPSSSGIACLDRCSESRSSPPGPATSIWWSVLRRPPSPPATCGSRSARPGSAAPICTSRRASTAACRR